MKNINAGKVSPRIDYFSHWGCRNSHLAITPAVWQWIFAFFSTQCLRLGTLRHALIFLSRQSFRYGKALWSFFLSYFLPWCKSKIHEGMCAWQCVRIKSTQKIKTKKCSLRTCSRSPAFLQGQRTYCYVLGFCLTIKCDPSLRAPSEELCGARSNLLCMV